MIHIVDYTGSLEHFVPEVQKQFAVKIKYTKGTAKTKGKKDAENFLRHVEGSKKIWVIPHPLEHNDTQIFGYTMGDRSVVSSHGLSTKEVVTVVKHELGHILGLPHCNEGCFMYNTHPSDVPEELCESCKYWLLTQIGG